MRNLAHSSPQPAYLKHKVSKKVFIASIWFCIDMTLWGTLKETFCFREGKYLMTGGELMKLLGRNLRKYRADVNMTQEEFSESIGVNLSTYKNIERGARGASFDMIATIAERLNITPSDLFQEGGKEFAMKHIDELLKNRSESFIIATERMIEALDKYDVSLNKPDGR